MKTEYATAAFSRVLAPSHTSVSQLTTKQHRITMNEVSCAWNEVLEQRLEKLIQLPNSWDGYRARPVSFPVAVFTLSMLQRLFQPSVTEPFLVPGINGDLQAEWHANDMDIEIHVVEPNLVKAWRRTPNTSDEGEEITLRNDFTEIAIWVKEFADTAGGNAAAAA